MGDLKRTLDSMWFTNPLGDYSPRNWNPFDPISVATLGQSGTGEVFGFDNFFDPLELGQDVDPGVKQAAAAIVSAMFPAAAPAASAAIGYEQGGNQGLNMGLASSIGGAALGDALGGAGVPAANKLGSMAVNTALQLANAPEAPNMSAAPGADIAPSAGPTPSPSAPAPAGFPVTGSSAPPIAPWFVDDMGIAA